MDEVCPKPSILYVEDRVSHQVLFQRAFRSRYNVLVADSGAEAIEIIKKNDVFLVIADHNMPGMTGIDFLEKAQEISPKSSKALLSAYLDDAIKAEATRRVGLARQLPKPWRLDRMREFIEESYQRYEIDRGAPKADPSPEGIAPTPTVPWEKLIAFVERFEARVNHREARRVFLNHVEPRLKDYIPLLRRPVAESFRKAQVEALKGNAEELQKYLSEYLREEALADRLIILPEKETSH